MAQFIIGIIILVAAGKLIYSTSPRAFVNKAAQKAWVSRGNLIRTYTDNGNYYGTYEYEADGTMYTLDVEYTIDFYKNDPPVHMGIYYQGSNPQKACVREQSAVKDFHQDMKRGILFCIVLMIVATFWYFTV